MKFPERLPRNEPSLEKYTYYDHEVVNQDDGQIAKFIWNSKEKEKGWQFDFYQDKYGFRIWNDGELSNENSKFLISHEILNEQNLEDIRNLILDDNEELHAYQYDGVLSMRSGFYITPKNNPNKILRSLGTRMS